VARRGTPQVAVGRENEEARPGQRVDARAGVQPRGWPFPPVSSGPSASSGVKWAKKGSPKSHSHLAIPFPRAQGAAGTGCFLWESAFAIPGHCRLCDAPIAISRMPAKLLAWTLENTAWI